MASRSGKAGHIGLSETVRVSWLISGSHEEDKVKRSEINGIIRDAGRFIRQRGYYLPPFAYWTPQDWSTKGEEARDIVENQLGWDRIAACRKPLCLALSPQALRISLAYSWRAGGVPGAPVKDEYR